MGIRIWKYSLSILFFYDFPLISSVVTNLLFFPPQSVCSSICMYDQKKIYVAPEHVTITCTCKWCYRSSHSHTRQETEVTSQSHVPVTLSPVKEPPLRTQYVSEWA